MTRRFAFLGMVLVLFGIGLQAQLDQNTNTLSDVWEVFYGGTGLVGECGLG